MGISTEVYTVYGWKVKVCDGLGSYLESIDYDYPEGVITDMDCEDMWFGNTVFSSADHRWGEMYGESNFTEETASAGLHAWVSKNNEVFKNLWEYATEENPKFFSFVNYS